MSWNPINDARVWFSSTREEDRFLPEGPREMTVNGVEGVLWVNIQTSPDAKTGELLYRPWTGGEPQRFELPGRPGFALPTDRADVVLVGCEKQIGTFNLKSKEWSPLATIPNDNPRVIINDGEPVPGGEAVLFGSKDTNFADPIAQLYLYTIRDNVLSPIAEGQTCSNGKVIRREGADLILYDIDTPQRVVTRSRLDLAKRSLSSAKTVIDLRSRSDFPDGMCDCGDGTVFIAFYNPEYADAGCAVRYRLDTGEFSETLRTPGSPRVTCPLLVSRPEGVRLLLTTATEGMPSEMRAKCPNAGSLFLGPTHVNTLPETERVRLG